MAQPVYDEQGPLESYLRSAGEGTFVPGDLDGSMWDDDESFMADDDTQSSHELLQSLPESLAYIWTIISGHSMRPSSLSFEERFKYDVVSSSLLASDLQEHSTSYSPIEAGPPATPSMPSFPGELQVNSHDTSDVRWLLAFGGLAGLVTSIYYELSSDAMDRALTLLSSVITYITCVPVSQATSMAPEMTSTIHALHDLISASHAWDSVVQDALTYIESDEARFRLPSSTNLFTPSSSLRIAAQTSLHTTTTQCDNVRTLMTAITKQSELVQLTEMYAPSAYPSLSPLPRPMSLPLEQQAKEEEEQTDVDRKRKTWSVGNSPTSPLHKEWNGSYASIANAGSPTMRVMKRREKRRSDLSALLNMSSTSSGALGRSPTLQSPELPSTEEEPFGPSALAMRRKRQSDSLMTRLAPSRHPLSLSSLTQSLHSALQAKRYTCAHLLALRFDEEEESSDYWEDVRSVMSLLTSTFSDVAVRLTEAMETEEETRINDEKPSRTPSWNLSSVPSSTSTRVSGGNRPSGFAPSLGSLARFGLHAQGVISALDDARGHLDECLDVLRKSEDNPSMGLEDVQEHPALAAYDRLRRELGIALRECERGREKLLDLVKPAQPEISSEEEEAPVAADTSVDTPLDEGEEENQGEVVVEHGVDLPLDDISAQLERLEPPGVEQVFESDELSGNVHFMRERSKISREERIQLAKKTREEAAVSADDPSRHWGPGGDVVQELKDVIWQVGQRKRKMRESLQLQPPPPASPPHLPLPPLPPHEPLVDDTSASCQLPHPMAI